MIKYENKENGRYFYMYVERDELDDLVLVIMRGGRYNHVVRRYGFNCESRIECELGRLRKKREARGYTLVTS